MKRNNKLYSAVLLLTLVGMSLSALYPSQCPAVSGCAQTPAPSAMACCATPANTGEVSISARCCCQISGASEVDVPLTYLTERAQNVEKRFEEKVGNTTKTQSVSSCERAFAHLATHFFYHPKFSTDLKIYDFVESYLI